MVAEELKIIVSAEVASAMRNMQRVQRSTNNTQKSMGSLVKGLAASAAGFVGVSMAIRETVRFLGASAQAASDAEETFSKFGTVFDQVGHEASRAMEELADSFGLADSTAARLLGNTGDLLIGFGLTSDAALDLSVQTNELALDLASFTNAQGGAEAVSRALTSAYAGERESLKSYGIVISQADVEARVLQNTMEGLTFESERQANAIATLQLAQEQSTNAIGDYARTSESAANVQRRLGEAMTGFKETLGDLVLDGMTPFRQALIVVVEQADAFFQSIQQFRDFVRGTEEDLDQTAAAVQRWEGNIADLEQEISEVESEMTHWNSVLREARNAAGDYGVSLYELGRDYYDWGERLSEANRRLEIGETSIERYNRQISNLRNAIRRVTESSQDNNDANEENAESTEDMSDALDRYNRIMAEMAERQDERFLEGLDDDVRAITLAERELDRLVDLREEFQEQEFETAGTALQAEINSVVAELQRLRDASGETDEELNLLGTSFNALIGDMDAAETASDTLTRQMREDAARTRASIRANWDGMTESNIAAIHRQAQEFREAGIDAADVAQWQAREIAAEYIGMANQVVGAFQGAAGALSAFISTTADNQIAEQQRVLDEITRSYEAQIDFAKAAGATETELAELRAQQAAEQAELEEEMADKERDAKRKAFAVDKAAQIASATMAAANAVVQALPNIPLSIAIGALGAAQVGLIASTPMPAFEKGGSFVTSGPQAIMVGDGQSPRERVTVEPLTGPYASGGGGDIHVHISGVVGSREEVANWVNEAIRRGRERGRIRA